MVPTDSLESSISGKFTSEFQRLATWLQGPGLPSTMRAFGRHTRTQESHKGGRHHEDTDRIANHTCGRGSCLVANNRQPCEEESTRWRLGVAVRTDASQRRARY